MTSEEPSKVEVGLLLDYVSMVPNLRVLMHIESQRRMHKISESIGISRQAVSAIVDKLEELGWVRRTKRLGDVELTDTGRRALAQGVRDVFTCAQAIRGKADERSLQSLRDRLHLKVLLGRVCRGSPLLASEAMRLEDEGWCKREGRNRIKLTEKGEQEFRLMSRGPLPGGGNRSTIIR